MSQFDENTERKAEEDAPRDRHEQMRFKRGRNSCLESMEKMARALDFYSKGGNFNTDVWKHEDLGYFTGSMAKAVIAQVKDEGNWPL